MSVVAKSGARLMTVESASSAAPARSQPEARKRLVGDQVRRARGSPDLAQLELARTLEIGLAKLSHYEYGLATSSRLLLARFILGLAVGRKAREGTLRSSPRPN